MTTASQLSKTLQKKYLCFKLSARQNMLFQNVTTGPGELCRALSHFSTFVFIFKDKANDQKLWEISQCTMGVTWGAPSRWPALWEQNLHNQDNCSSFSQRRRLNSSCYCSYCQCSLFSQHSLKEAGSALTLHLLGVSVGVGWCRGGRNQASFRMLMKW